MKIFFNPVQQYNNQKYLKTKREIFKNYVVMFGLNQNAKVLLDQADTLLCAYSGKKMISPQVAKQIMAKLEKCPNIQSVINALSSYRNYMGSVEGKIYDLFSNKNSIKQYGNKTFPEIFNQMQFNSANRLNIRKTEILDKINEQISQIHDNSLALKIVVDDIIQKIENGKLGKKSALETLNDIYVNQSDRLFFNKTCELLDELPRRSDNIDAFIVNHSDSSHEQIAKRLISSAFATIEHVKPQSEGGVDKLSNYILVRAEQNNQRSSMSLDNYINLQQGLNIPKNLQRYIDLIIQKANKKGSVFYDKAWYIIEIVKTIYRETNSKVLLKVKGLKVPKENIFQ